MAFPVSFYMLHIQRGCPGNLFHFGICYNAISPVTSEIKRFILTPLTYSGAQTHSSGSVRKMVMKAQTAFHLFIRPDISSHRPYFFHLLSLSFYTSLPLALLLNLFCCSVSSLALDIDLLLPPHDLSVQLSLWVLLSQLPAFSLLLSIV